MSKRNRYFTENDCNSGELLTVLNFNFDVKMLFCIHKQMSHWPCVKRLAHTVGLSAIQAIKCEREESETLTAMAGLSMQPLRYSIKFLIDWFKFLMKIYLLLIAEHQSHVKILKNQWNKTMPNKLLEIRSENILEMERKQLPFT